MKSSVVCGFNDVFTFDTDTIRVAEVERTYDEFTYRMDKDEKFRTFVREHNFCAGNGHFYGEGFSERVYDLYLRLCGAGLV